MSENIAESSIPTASGKTTVVLGAINMDLLVETERLARPGETFTCDGLYTSGGGKAGNQSVAAARFTRRGSDYRVKMIGRVGDDVFGNDLRNAMSAEGVDVHDVSIDGEVETGVAIIFIDRDGENYVHAVYGGNGRCGAIEASAAIKTLSRAGVLLVQQEIPITCSIEAMRAAKDLGVPVVLDPAPARTSERIPTDFYAVADIVTPNAWEAEALAGVHVNDVRTAHEASARIRERFGTKCAIVTLADEGVYVNSDGLTGHIDAFKVDAVATVAAGDAFAGVLGAALCEGSNLETAIHLAMAAGAICASNQGTQSAMPYRNEIFTLAGISDQTSG